MPLSVGTPAPDFALPVKPKEDPLLLAHYKGERSVVLMFFPLAFSSTCTAQMCTVAENYRAWEALDAEVIGISVDSPWTNQKFAAECGATFPIASDFNKDVSAAYDALYDELMGLKGVTPGGSCTSSTGRGRSSTPGRARTLGSCPTSTRSWLRWRPPADLPSVRAVPTSAPPASRTPAPRRRTP